MLYIIAIHMVGGERHEHIAEVKWQNATTGNAGHSTRAAMVEWLRENPKQAVVKDGGNSAFVGIVEVDPPYIRTYADGVWNNNLLALPRY